VGTVTTRVTSYRDGRHGGQWVQIEVEARYLSHSFTSLTVFCGNLLHALVELGLDQPPVVLLPRALHPSAHQLRDDLGDAVKWVRPERDNRESGLRGELRWMHRDVPRLLATSAAGSSALITTYHSVPVRAPGVPSIAVVHDLCGLGVGFPRNKKAYWRHYARLRSAAHFADVIWPISEATRDALASRFRASRSRIGPVIYNGVSREPASERVVEATLLRHGLERGAYVVAFATRQARKNFAATLATLEELRRRGTPVRLVGITPPSEVDDVEDWVRSVGLHDALILSGIPDAELDALYAGALALLWPSLCEGFGYPVVEAMIQGCPPLVSSSGPGAELLASGLRPLDSLDPPDIADRILELQASALPAKEALAAALRARAAAFSPDIYRERLRGALADATTRGSASGSTAV
jgi:glycosyltransferase involved in cell wall biosynthesis